MKKTKLLPICGALASTAAIVTPLATSCSSWTRYTDMLSEYKPGVKSYKETYLDYYGDGDDLYWARFVENHDIVRDDILWTLSKVMCNEMTDDALFGFQDVFKEVQEYNFDIHIDKVINSDEDDEYNMQFTIDWDFKAQYNKAYWPQFVLDDGSTGYIDVIDLHMSFSTIDPWEVWIDDEIGYASSEFEFNKNHYCYAMCLERPAPVPATEPKGLVHITSDSEFRYTDKSTADEGNKWDSATQNSYVRDLDSLHYDHKQAGQYDPTDYTFDAYEFMFDWLISPLELYIVGDVESISEDCIQFCSHYLENVYIEPWL